MTAPAPGGAPPAEAARETAQVQLHFEDNALAAALYGQHDRYLARIEQQLGVALVPRGNLLAVSGTVDQVQEAQAALAALYERLRRGLHVDMAEVDAALRMAHHSTVPAEAADEAVIHTRKRRISPRSPTQGTYIRALAGHDLVFGLGPAGTGKTYLAVAMAVQMLLKGEVDRIILSRPAVEAGERLGFLPGDLKEKVDPYLRPLYDALYDMLPGDQVMKRLASGEIEVAPLAFMRGRTLTNAYVILDEAQNTTPVQMKMFLTRLGENSRMAVTGDLSQIDLPSGMKSGLADALEAVGRVQGVATVTFSDADVVRHPLVTRLVRAYGAHEARARDRRGRPGRGPGRNQSEEAPE